MSRLSYNERRDGMELGELENGGGFKDDGETEASIQQRRKRPRDVSSSDRDEPAANSENIENLGGRNNPIAIDTYSLMGVEEEENNVTLAQQGTSPAGGEESQAAQGPEPAGNLVSTAEHSNRMSLSSNQRKKSKKLALEMAGGQPNANTASQHETIETTRTSTEDGGKQGGDGSGVDDLAPVGQGVSATTTCIGEECRVSKVTAPSQRANLAESSKGKDKLLKRQKNESRKAALKRAEVEAQERSGRGSHIVDPTEDVVVIADDRDDTDGKCASGKEQCSDNPDPVNLEAGDDASANAGADAETTMEDEVAVGMEVETNANDDKADALYSEEDIAVLVVGKSAPRVVKSMAASRLSKWAMKFTEQRAYTQPVVPTIEPINDDYLAGFGRSYTESKNRAKVKRRENARATAAGERGEDNEEGNPADYSDGDSGEESGESDHPSEEDVPITPGTRVVLGSSSAEATPKNLGRREKKHGVFLMNLPYEVCDEKALTKIFTDQGFGKIFGVVLSRPPEGKIKAGSAMMYFAMAEDAAKAVARNGMLLRGRCINIREARVFASVTPSRYFVEATASCDHCGDRRHTSDKCQHSTGICTLCGGNGHSENICPNNACSLCFQVGHIKEACPNRNVSPKTPEKLCSGCGGYGHVLEGCQAEADGQEGEGFSCVACRDFGHTHCGRPIRIVCRDETGRASVCWSGEIADHDGFDRDRGIIGENGGLKMRNTNYNLDRRRSTGSVNSQEFFNGGSTGHVTGWSPESRNLHQTMTPGRYGSNHHNAAAYGQPPRDYRQYNHNALAYQPPAPEPVLGSFNGGEGVGYTLPLPRGKPFSPPGRGIEPPPPPDVGRSRTFHVGTASRPPPPPPPPPPSYHSRSGYDRDHRRGSTSNGSSNNRNYSHSPLPRRNSVGDGRGSLSDYRNHHHSSDQRGPAKGAKYYSGGNGGSVRQRDISSPPPRTYNRSHEWRGSERERGKSRRYGY